MREEFEDILRFWFDRGVDGVRIDSAALLREGPGAARLRSRTTPPFPHPFTDRDEVHDDLPRLARDRRLATPDDRVLIGEVWLPDAERFAHYLRPDELHTAFNFDFLGCPWDAARLRDCIDATLAAHAPVGAPATWVLSNHDVTRHVTRYGRADTTFELRREDAGDTRRVDLALGHPPGPGGRAADAVALPGAAYVYQGEELGLGEVEDIPDDGAAGPMFSRTGGADPGRDGCRVPLPWSGDAPPFGFSPAAATGPPWLPQPACVAGVHRGRRRNGDPTRCSRSTGRRCGSGGAEPDSATARCAGSTRPECCVRPRRRLRLRAEPLGGAVELPRHDGCPAGERAARGRLACHRHGAWRRSLAANSHKSATNCHYLRSSVEHAMLRGVMRAGMTASAFSRRAAAAGRSRETSERKDDEVQS